MKLPPFSNFFRPWLVCAAGLLVLVSLWPARARADADDGPPAPMPVRVAVENGETVVKLSPAEIKRVALATEILPATMRRPRQTAYGTVLDLTPLLNEAASLAATRAEAETASATLAAARAEYDRARALHSAGQNISTRELQSAEAAWRGADAADRAAQTAWQARRAALAQTWGPALARWLEGGTPEFQRLAQGESRLLRLVLPGEMPATPPAEANVQCPDGQWAEAALVSPAAQADPEFQGAAYYFLAPAAGGLTPGLNLIASVAAPGAARAGVIVPAAAVVWWQGQAWVYLQERPGVFARRAMATDEPAAHGDYFVRDLPAATPVVVAGASVLLSEETRPAVAPDAD